MVLPFEQETFTHIRVKYISKCSLLSFRIKIKLLMKEAKILSKERPQTFSEEVSISIHIVWIVFSATETELSRWWIILITCVQDRCERSASLVQLSLLAMCAIHKIVVLLSNINDKCSTRIINDLDLNVSLKSFTYYVKPHYWVPNSVGKGWRYIARSLWIADNLPN